MANIESIILGYILTFCFLLLSILYPVRLYCQKHKLTQTSKLYNFKEFLHNIHKPLGIASVVLTTLHCIISSQHPALNSGTLCLILVLLILFTYLLRKILKRKWLKYHRILTAILWFTILTHIILWL